MKSRPGTRLYRGANYFPRKDRWRSRITYNKKHYHSPYFKTAQEAEDWYERKSFELYGYDRVHDILPLDGIDLI